MFLKSVALLLVSVAVFTNAGVIYEPETLLDTNEYQMMVGEPSYYSEPMVVHLRERRQAEEQNKQDRGSVGADVSRGPDGTRVRVDTDYNLHRSRDGRTSVDARAGYERQYGGPRGTGRPNYDVGVQFRHRF